MKIATWNINFGSRAGRAAVHLARSRGLRIDHFLLSNGVAARCTKAEIDRDARKGKLPSDHAPVWVEIS